MTVRFIAFTARRDIKVDGWESLKGKQYRIDYQNGSEYMRERASHYTSPSKLQPLYNMNQGMQQMVSNRADIFIWDEIDMRARLNASKFRDMIFNAGVVGGSKINLHSFFLLFPCQNSLLLG